MAHQFKFWTVRPAVINAEKTEVSYDVPAMPAGTFFRRTAPGDLRVAEGGGAHPEGAHTHAIFGGNAAVPSVDVTDDHWHHLIRKNDGTIKQIAVPDSAPSHDHTGTIDALGRIMPKWLMIKVNCDDVAEGILDSAGWLKYAEFPFDEETETFGELSNETWPAAKRTAAEQKVAAGLGLALPSIIDSDVEFIYWLLDVGAYRYEKEWRHE